MELGFTAYLPLLVERSGPEMHIAALWRGYILTLFNPATDQWRRIYRARGIAGLIGESTDRPTPIGVGIIEELIARTSARRIVDDPGANPPLVAAERQHWQDITRLSAKARGELLLRLFGREDVAA
jgi:transcription antitermination factor NusG